MSAPTSTDSITTHAPRDVPELAQLLTECNERRSSLEILGGGSKRNLGQAVRSRARLRTSGLSGVEFYEPEELVIKVRAGTTLEEVEHTLQARRQHLAFEPPDYSTFYGDPGARQSIGGVIACNLSGPRRIQAGAARDGVLGIEAVNGRGEIFKTGGRTVKNVTGYDLPKLLTGSFGVLAVLTAITLKVLPNPDHETTLLLKGLSEAKALDLLSAVLAMPLEVSGAVHIAHDSHSAPVTAIRLEGLRESVEARVAELESRLHAMADIGSLSAQDSGSFWSDVRDLKPFQTDTSESPACVWRLTLPSTHAARIVTTLGVEAIYDWGGSQVFLRMTAADVEQHATMLRSMVGEVGGSACLMRAPSELRANVGVFQPRAPALEALSERIRQMFDPGGILNPGKLGAPGAGSTPR